MAENANIGAMSIEDFAERYSIGRSLAYEQIRTGKLRAVKVGPRRTIVLTEDALRWQRSLEAREAAAPKDAA